MKMKVILEELSHEDLVALFSTAIDGNGFISVDYQEEDSEHKFGYEIDDCYEDKIAKCLLRGGNIKIVDFAADGEESKEDVEHYGIEGENWDKKMYRRTGGYWYPVYILSLPTLLKGLSTPDASALVKETIDGDGDIYTAYNALQIAVFGEEVYG